VTNIFVPSGLSAMPSPPEPVASVRVCASVAGLGLQEQQQVIRTARFGVRSGHVEAAEGVRADHGAGAFPVEIQVADVEALLGFPQMFGVIGEDRAGQPVLRIVGQFQGVLEVVGLGDGQHRAENLLLEDAVLGLDVGNDGGRMK
jgi:hypothetical protein